MDCLIETLNEKLSRTSSEPGVYLMKDAGGKIIYVGKALNLKKRLSSYFKNPAQLNIKTAALVSKIASFETIITGTEADALMLESNLIKRYRPKYNIILKDDKRYPSLRMDIHSPYPNLTMVRKVEKDGAVYFGPYSSPRAVYETLKFIHKTFKLRKCRKELKRRTRPCLNYQMGACLGPCCRHVDPVQYGKMVKEVMLFLNGKTTDLIQNIEQEMMDAAEAQDFETAAALRDRMLAIQKTVEKQVVVTTDFADRDIIGAAKNSERTWITLLFVRNGYLLGARHFNFVEILTADEELLGTFIRQYYENALSVPSEILIPSLIEDAQAIEDWIKQMRDVNTHIQTPKTEEQANLLNMAQQNAQSALAEWTASESVQLDLLKRLQNRLRIRRIPFRIECFDNSNMAGKDSVSGMVVFQNGKPDKGSYRTYQIKTISGPDDYGSMLEILRRRFGKKNLSEPHPDLLMVDGGRGQLNMAMAVLKELHLDGEIDVVGIAKKDERAGETEDKIYKPGRSNPIHFGKEKDLLLFLQRIRDEAHRWAISFHRKRRRITLMHSVLDEIPGLGGKRKQTLLRHFGSVQNIRTASTEELKSLPGMNLSVAETVRQYLNKPMDSDN